MVAYTVVFIQHNLGRRHEPSASLSHLLAELTPFSFLRRDRAFLNSAIERSAFPDFLESLKSYVGPEGILPRILPVALVQEPVVHDSRVVGFGNYKVLAMAQPRAAIITLACADIFLAIGYSTRDTAIGLMRMNGRPVMIGSFITTSWTVKLT